MSGSRSTVSCRREHQDINCLDLHNLVIIRRPPYPGRNDEEIGQRFLDGIGHVVLVDARVFELVDDELDPVEREISVYSVGSRAHTRVR